MEQSYWLDGNRGDEGLLGWLTGVVKTISLFQSPSLIASSTNSQSFSSMTSVRASTDNIAAVNKPTAMDYQFVDQLLANREALPLHQNLGSLLDAVLKSDRLAQFEAALTETRERIEQ